jgi:ferritin
MSLSKKMHKSLLDQVRHEWEAELYYLQMMAWCRNHDYDGFAAFFRGHADEERVHGMKILDYLAEVDADIAIPSIKTHDVKLEAVEQLFELALEHEEQVTAWIHELMALSQDERDYRTQHFLQWYVSEQIEEESLIRTALARVRRAKDHPGALLMVEEQIARLESDAGPAES